MSKDSHEVDNPLKERPIRSFEEWKSETYALIAKIRSNTDDHNLREDLSNLLRETVRLRPRRLVKWMWDLKDLAKSYGGETERKLLALLPTGDEIEIWLWWAG